MDTVDAIRRIETARSRELVERLARSMPGGDTRSITFFPPYPLTIERGSGYRIWDVDGNEFVDLLNNYTSLVHGHAVPQISEALSKQMTLGTAFSSPGELQAELAERICSRVASIERVRFANSGTEAVMMAVRGARAFTGREKIVKADGGYHGAWEQTPLSWREERGASDGDKRATGRSTASKRAAVPEGVRKLVHMVDYNDVQQLATTMEEDGENVAAIILEPVMGTAGVIAGTSEYFADARRLADEYGALLILDEVQTLRLHSGGLQETLGVRPDLTTMGKIIGGGLPVGAFGGRREVMDVFNPRSSKHVIHSGTFNGNPMTMTAGCVSLDLLTQSEIDRINALGDMLADGLRRAFAQAAIDGAVTNWGSMVNVHFGTGGEVRQYSDLNLESPILPKFHLAALEEGVYFAPRGFLNTSTAMDETVIEEALDACSRAAQRVAGS